MFAILKLPITEPTSPALATPVTVSDTELTVVLDRPSTGPTQLAYYTLERSLAGEGSWTQIAQGLEIFPFSDTGLTPGTSYDYRANSTDTTDRTSAWGYAEGRTDVEPVTEERSVWFSGSFESGQILPYTGQTDGFYFGTLPEPQTGSTAYFTSTGGAGPATALDTKVVTSETWGSDSITPRDGSYFLRSAIYKTKDYTDTRFSSGADRPRSLFYLTHSSNLLDWDTEAWFGMSVWLPSNMEHDTATKNEAAEVQLLVVNPNWPSNTHMDFKYYVGGSDTISRWALRYYVGATSTAESAATSTTVNLGLVTADLGRWTDWIFRVRFNPFTTTTNPGAAGIPNAKNQSYAGNRGILEVWKNGTKVFSRMNQPLGLVPWTTRDLSFLPRLYKSNWKLFPTSVVGPVYCAFDSIRYGQVTRDGTGYADVNPAGTAPASGQEPA